MEPDLAEIVSEGRAERGSPLVLRGVTTWGDTLPRGTVQWSVDPSAAGTWRGDTLRLAEAGTIRVTATYERGTVTRALEIASPPRVLFDMLVGGNRDIYQVAIDGRDLERLTTDAAADYDPTVAAGTIIFVSDRDGNGELYAMPLSGRAERRLTRTGADEMHPALSRDGARLAFARGAGLSRLYVADADANDAVRPDPAHGHGGTLESTPAWSPDGRTLVFMSTANGNPDLFRWSGGAASLLEDGRGGEFEPAWSPDGRAIAFVSTRTGDAELYLLSVPRGEVTRLTEREGSDGHPAWLPDGRLVYVAFSDGAPALRWLDPAAPSESHPIPLPGAPGNPVGLPR